MANAYVWEIAEVGHFQGSTVPVPRLGTVQTVSFTTSTASSAFGANTKYVRVVADAACHFTVGDSPTATTSHFRLAADNPQDILVAPGQQIAFVTVS